MEFLLFLVKRVLWSLLVLFGLSVVIFGIARGMPGDPARLAKVLVDYAKEHEVFKLRGGFMDGQPLATTEIATLATLPSLDELRAKLVGLIQAPATKVAGVLAAPAGQLARLTAARQKQLEEAGGAS